MATASKYAVSYGCTNCFAQFTQTFLKGQEAPKKLMCKTCGTYNASKGWSRPFQLPKPYVDPMPRIPGPPPWNPAPWRPYSPPWVREVTCAHVGVICDCSRNMRMGGGEGQRDFLC